jgi:short-subunit dehydrogenase
MGRQLKGSRILLTGASRGIGRQVAQFLGEYGARLVLTARSKEDLEKVVQELKGKGVEAHAIAADITSPPDRERLVQSAVDILGGLDVLINNAGTASFGEFATSSEEILRQIMEINFFAPVELIRLCLPYLAKSPNKPGIVNVASICGRRGIPSFPEHCASKFALVGLTEALRGEFTRFGVDMNLVVPGLVRVDDREKHLLRSDGKITINWEKAQKPEKVARGIVRALRWNWYETVIGTVALWLHRGNRVFPWLIDGIMNRKVRKFAEREKKK